MNIKSLTVGMWSDTFILTLADAPLTQRYEESTAEYIINVGNETSK